MDVSLETAFAMIRSAVRNGASKVGDKSEDIVKEHVQKDVYGTYGSPSVYKRTYQLRDSVKANVTSSGSDTDIEIKNEGMSGHPSVITGANMGEAIPQIVTDGAPNIFRGSSGGAWTGARPYMDNALQTLESNDMVKSTLKDALRAHGFKVE